MFVTYKLIYELTLLSQINTQEKPSHTQNIYLLAVKEKPYTFPSV